MILLAKILELLVLTFGVGFLATWAVRGIMRRLGIMDNPVEGSRKSHGRPVAYEGGLGIWAAIMVGIVAAFSLFPELILHVNALWGLAVGATIIVAIGAADDILDMRAVVKLAAQLGVGALMYYYGFRIERISNPFGGEVMIWTGFSVAGTMLWYGLLINGINMIDGMDGLAAGIVAISAVTLGAVALDLDMTLSLLLCVILLGACLGFLPFNFSPATIFMGDAGSMLLGFMLASITLLSSSKAPALLALLIPMLAVGVPLFETVFAFTRRILQGKHPFRADRRHLHHRFLALGFTERRTVLMFYYLTAYFGVTAFVLQKLEARATLPLVGIIGLGMLVLIENMRYLEKKRLLIVREEVAVDGGNGGGAGSVVLRREVVAAEGAGSVVRKRGRGKKRGRRKSGGRR